MDADVEARKEKSRRRNSSITGILYTGFGIAFVVLSSYGNETREYEGKNIYPLRDEIRRTEIADNILSDICEYLEAEELDAESCYKTRDDTNTRIEDLNGQLILAEEQIPDRTFDLPTRGIDYLLGVSGIALALVGLFGFYRSTRIRD